MALSLSNLAILYHEQGNYVEAELLYSRALAISEKAFDKDHPDVATVLENMAFLYEKIWKKDEAKELIERVKKIRSKNQ
jgi:tetratricopeptide (TPR) repeat protein